MSDDEAKHILEKLDLNLMNLKLRCTFCENHTNLKKKDN